MGPRSCITAMTVRTKSPIAKPNNVASRSLPLLLWPILLVTRLDQSSPFAFLTMTVHCLPPFQNQDHHHGRRRTTTSPIQMLMMRPLRHRPDDDDNDGDVENTTTTKRKNNNNNDENSNQRLTSSSLSSSSSWKQEDPISQAIVSALTAVVNALSFNTNKNNDETAAAAETPPPPPLLLLVSSPPGNAEELLRRIACDYTERNYLWTGDLDYACYDENCRFADPTLTFTGTATYARNVGNLRPIVDRLVVDPDGNGGPRSELLSIRLVNVNGNEGDSNNNNDTSSSSSATFSTTSSASKSFVQTRWNMVGDLRLPWRPRIDVMGQTRFWFGTGADGGVRIYHYDETWEIPPWRALSLLQLVTPAGTIPNSSIVVDRDEPSYHTK